MSKMSKWISVKDRFPEVDNYGFDEGEGISDSVLISYRCKDDVSGTIYRRVGHFFKSTDGDLWTLSECLTYDCLPRNHEELIEVSHWMPLPDHPTTF